MKSLMCIALILFSCGSQSSKTKDNVAQEPIKTDSIEVDFGDGIQLISVNDTSSTMSKYISLNYLNPKPATLENVGLKNNQVQENGLTITIADSGKYFFQSELGDKVYNYKIVNISEADLPYLYFIKCLKSQNSTYTSFYFVYSIMIPNTTLVEQEIFTAIWDKKANQIHFVELSKDVNQYSFSKLSFSDINEDGFADIINYDFNNGEGSYLVFNPQKWTYERQNCFDLSQNEDNLYLKKSFKKVDCK